MPVTDVAPHQLRNGSAHRQQAVPGVASESATWWCWWGSPELVAQAARTALRRMQEVGEGDVRCAIAMTVGRDRETFTSPDQFLLCVTPEGLRHFSSLELRVTCDDLELVAVFTRPPRRGLRSGGSHTAHMEVTPADESRRADALEIARGVAAALSRGYARYWAGCGSTPQLRDELGRPLPFRGSLVMAAVVVVGMLLGAGLARILDDLPGIELSSLATVALLTGVGMLYPVLVARVVLNVEVAPAGRTRLVLVARSSAAALATFVATQAIQLIVA